MSTHRTTERPGQERVEPRSADADYAERTDALPEDDRHTREETVIPVAREELDVHTRRVETDAGVRVHIGVREREAIVDEPLEKDEVRVERVRIGRPVSAPVDVRYEGDTMIIPVLEEVLVVEKRLVLQEEIRVTRSRSALRMPRRVILRAEEAQVERIDAALSGEARHDLQEERTAAAPHAASAASDEALIERKRRETEDLRERISTPTRRD